MNGQIRAGVADEVEPIVPCSSRYGGIGCGRVVEEIGSVGRGPGSVFSSISNVNVVLGPALWSHWSRDNRETHLKVNRHEDDRCKN